MERRLERMMSKLDADGDGAISKAEAETSSFRGKRMLRDFDALDGDGDGALSSAELAESVKTMKRKMGKRKRGHFGRRGPRSK